MTIELLGLPPQYREALTRLAALPEQAASRLTEAIAAVDALSSVGIIAAAAQAALDADESLRADRLIPPLLSLRSELRERSADEIADTLSRSTDLGLDSNARQRLRDRAAQILRTPAVSTTAVGIDLLTQHQRNYRSARIFTDVRPLFGEDVESPPIGAVVVEMLQLQTWDRDGQSQTLHVAMDEADLEELQGVIKRALKKTTTIKTMLAAQKLPTLELDERSS